MLRTFATTEEALDAAPQDSPMYCLRPRLIADTAREAIAAFPGEVMYAVKCNDHPVVLQALAEGGIRHWDVASAAEVRGTHTLFPDHRLSFMHPVKTPRAIEEAYFEHGVRVFALDHAEELDKILAATENADDLTLMVRLGTVAGMALVDLSSKFGIDPKTAAPLLRACRDRTGRAGLTFHVGSQCISASAWIKALEMASQAVDLAKVPIDLLDVGGGFPARYRGDEPTFPEVSAEIREALDWITFKGDPKVLCEPGRALVAGGMSAVVRVELRAGDRLYLNDGVYGGLSELKLLGPVFPMRVLRPEGAGPVGEEAVFKFYGPTCDSIDTMPGPFWLPADVRTGDWIEIGMMGAYSNVLRTGFNGFWADRFVQVDDDGPVNEMLPDQVQAASPFAG
ncbi:Ornithine decarboxylase [Caenispirillum salinarum AK4]|uniref:ornithine decarboxylase n=1 Tax=Caenispirillum salinarum AK4 TaxID=1238182 RepID=K9GND9_9PROT|nr:type III PLP-dependent enzyme [Caenispirillum salinarum]EKV26597.1 Ornithine decarboxylase [Caenispirillum salinarum AK4]